MRIFRTKTIKDGDKVLGYDQNDWEFVMEVTNSYKGRECANNTELQHDSDQKREVKSDLAH